MTASHFISLAHYGFPVITDSFQVRYSSQILSIPKSNMILHKALDNVNVIKLLVAVHSAAAPISCSFPALKFKLHEVN